MASDSRITVLTIFSVIASVALGVVTMALISGRNTQKTVVFRSVLHEVSLSPRPGGEPGDPPNVQERHDFDIEVSLSKGTLLPVILHWSTRKDGTLGLQKDWPDFLSEVRTHLWGLFGAEMAEGITPQQFGEALGDALSGVGIRSKAVSGPGEGKSEASEDFLWNVRTNFYNRTTVFRGR